jgi:hypothetical protein
MAMLLPRFTRKIYNKHTVFFYYTKLFVKLLKLRYEKMLAFLIGYIIKEGAN